MNFPNRQALFLDFLPVALVYFINVFILTLVYPIFGSVVLSSAFGESLDPISQSIRPLLFGILTACFPLAQYLGFIPLLPLSKKVPRKLIVLFCLIGIVIGLYITSLGIDQTSILFLMIGRFISGFFAGNILYTYSFCLESKNHEALFSHRLVSITGIALIFGVAVGGIFSEPYFHIEYTNSSPTLIAIGLTTLIGILFFFLGKSGVHPINQNLIDAVVFKKLRISHHRKKISMPL
jgi:DHA1 family tetracycline resistance protein-like MFS transporter